MCPCGRMIGIDRDCDPPSFYDQNKWEAPVTHCPVCGALLTTDMLIHSGIVQPDPIVEALRILARHGQHIMEQEERELAARHASMTAPLDEATVQSGDDELKLPAEEPTTPSSV